MQYCNYSFYSFFLYQPPAEPFKITSDIVINFVCNEWGVDPNDLKSKKRNRYLSYPRQSAMKAILQFTSLSLKRVGMYFNRDHSTVIYAREKVFNSRVNKKHNIIVNKLNLLVA